MVVGVDVGVVVGVGVGIIILGVVVAPPLSSSTSPFLRFANTNTPTMMSARTATAATVLVLFIRGRLVQYVSSYTTCNEIFMKLLSTLNVSSLERCLDIPLVDDDLILVIFLSRAHYIQGYNHHH